MPVINLLPPQLADMIAAGEVVERPASVIKELMENSIDAGAKNITVEIQGGGATYIRVADDGCGMAPEDAGVAFLRHATSKLRDARGLEAIGTMGFRGEALAAISSVSDIELTTRRRGDSEGTYITLKAGDIQDMHPAGCPEGSTMIVRNLFFNTPARLKFLKSDRSEASACIQTALNIALGHPELSVRFLRDGKETFFSPGDGKLDSCIYTLLGRELAKDMLPCESALDSMRLTGFVSSPAAGRGNRAMQFFYCNGRYIRSTLLQAALEQAYKNTLLTGRYPSCVLCLDLSYASVDVNVHPAKTEVKFSSEKAVFDLVYHAVRFSLENEARSGSDPAAPSPSPAPARVEPRADFYRSMSAKDFRESGYRAPSAPAQPRTPSASPSEPSRSAGFSPSFPSMRAYELPYQTGLDLSSPPSSPVFDRKTPETTGFSPVTKPETVENAVQNVESATLPDHKIVGEALKTYILVEKGEALILIDKHAAHERMIFDKLRTHPGQIMSQNLLCPAPLHLSVEDAELLEKHGEVFAELGFEIEPLGETEYVIRAVPADMDSADAAAGVEEICDKIKRGKTPNAQSVRDEILHTVACKAAIKAGWNTEPQELSRLVAAVLSGEVKYCPHGRPVSVEITRRELDKMFKRIV